MNVECVDDYPLVGVDPDARIPPRSLLASLRPMGLGTPYRESLSSYYLGLAHLHHVSPKTLARELIIPRIKDGNARQSDDAFTIWKLPLFNGISSVPETWANILSELTGQQGLIDLTLVPLRPYMNVQRLMSSTKKWCPICLSEAAQEGRAYGQLLWEIAAIEACPKHGIKLVSQCRCNGSSPLSTRHVKHLSGFCGSCGYSLTENYEVLIESASEDEVKRAQLIVVMLGDIERLKPKSHRGIVGISEFLKSAAQHFTGGNAALLGKLLGIKKNTLHGWMNGKFIPSFPQMVEMSFACRSSIADVMLGTNTTFEGTEIIATHTVAQISTRTRKTQKLDRELIKRQLEMLSNENPPISVATAAEKLGVNRRTLFNRFGDIAKRMNQRFQAHRHSGKMRRFADKCDLYHQSAVMLMQQGIRPTQRLVAFDIKGIGIVGNKEDERIACSRICREVIKRSRLVGIDNQK